jgi:hypothetical protein
LQHHFHFVSNRSHSLHFHSTMRYSPFSLFAALFIATVSSAPVRRDVDPSLIPPFGHDAGINPTGTGNCDGAVIGSNGQPIEVPCTCPPPRDQFISDLNANVNAGFAVNNPGIPVSFPTDDSKASQLARINAALVTLQNLQGPGVGCPASSTTFVAQQSAIANGPGRRDAPPSPAAVAALAPSLGHQAGINPTGTGNCDGAVNGPNGLPIEVPCSCPPDQANFITALQANVAAGHAVNNPNVPFSFPLDGSTPSKIARIQASLVTLQNLNGPGVGCPASSTTLSAQLAALQ